MRSALEAAGVAIESAELAMEPKSVVEVGEGDARALMRLMEALDEHDDVDSVHANFDIPEGSSGHGMAGRWPGLRRSVRARRAGRGIRGAARIKTHGSSSWA